jgi:phenylacetate-coenzyme A ligase PaaK-like adenylate-forming protein
MFKDNPLFGFHPTAIFGISNSKEFHHLAAKLYEFQARNCVPFQQFIQYSNLSKINSDYLYLPVEIFKTHLVKSMEYDAEVVFTSSGTTGQEPSKHYVKSMEWYRRCFLHSFRLFYGNPEEYCFLCLLPSYLERSGSSLIYMAEHFIKNSKYLQSGFFLNNTAELANILVQNQNKGIPTVLLGVSFALLDMAEKYKLSIPDLIVMETGGMKGRRKELLREEVHQIICDAWGVKSIHSEYGMTELMSQAYSRGNGIFHCPPWMRVVIKDPYEPQKTLPHGSTGLINLIDLGNIWSCAFIATGDLGKTFPDGSFQVLGRLDRAEVRGCNLLLNQ